MLRRFYPVAVTPSFDINHAHNMFLQVALDMGIPGLIAYLALLMNTAVIGWQVAQRDEALRPFALGLLAGLAGLHVFGLADLAITGSKTGLLFWYALGLIAAMHQIVHKNDRS